MQIKRIILLIETSGAFGRDILSGIINYSKTQKSWIFYHEPQGIHPSNYNLLKWNADGIIGRDTIIGNKLLKKNIPTIIIAQNKIDTHKPCIYTDHKSISIQASNHLINLGFRNFGFCGYEKMEWSNQRKIFFIEYNKLHGYQTHVFQKANILFWDKEEAHIINWLKKLPKPIGIMAANDIRGKHVLEACKIAGFKVPEEVAVIGVDNDELLCDLCDPPLTSIALNTKSVGYEAAQLLDNMMNKKHNNVNNIVIYPTTTIYRQSTDVLAVDNPDVVAAIKFIHKNARNKLHVEDVVKHTNLSQRNLEQKFRQYFHCSINEEINRVRIELIKKMLLETNLTISEIAESFAFTDAVHINRYFSNITGIGLKTFRESFKNNSNKHKIRKNKTKN